MKPKTGPASEARVQSIARLEGGRHPNRKLWRNNVGVLKNPVGTPVRYGLANDTKELNEKIKSGDLIGWETVTITPEMVGMRIARFVSVECKEEGWTPAPPTNTKVFAHEEAQREWARVVIEAGGIAIFTTGKE
jgi:hypothetical protein